MKKFINRWGLIVFGAGIFFIVATSNSYGQADATPVLPDTNVSTAASTGTNVPILLASNDQSYTMEQLTNLLNANVDPHILAYQIDEWGVKLDIKTILNLHTNGVSDADLQRLQDALNYIRAEETVEAGSTNNGQINLDTNIVMVAYMFKAGISITNIAGYVSQSGLKLDPPTVLGMDKAGITLSQIQALQQFMATQAAAANSQTAGLNLTGVTNLNWAAVTNLPAGATNITMARTNLPLVADYAQRMATNLSILQTNNAQAFSMVSNNLEGIASGIKGYAANLQLQTNLPSSPYQAFISAGAQFLNPFAISVPNPTPFGHGSLTNAGNSTVGFVEFDYINRHVLRPRQENEYYTGKFFGGQMLYPSEVPPDIQFNMGFLFANSTGITNQNYTAQALAGSDFYSRLDLGVPIWRLDRPEQSHQVSMEFSGGVGTQRSFEQIHPNAFAGFGYETAFKPFIQSSFTNACGFFMAKAGVGWVDLPSMVGTNNLVNLDGNGSPRFDFTPACELSTYLAYPLTDKIFLTVEAVDYLGHRPPQSWNVKVGVAIPLDSITTTFSSMIKAVGGSP